MAATLGNQSEEVIKLLVQMGAEVNVQNSELKTPLFISIEVDNPLAASTLLSFNADYRIVSSRGTTAFEHLRDVDEWIKLGLFENGVKSVLEGELSISNSYI